MTFDKALEAMKDGKAVRRKAWETAYLQGASLAVPYGNGQYFVSQLIVKGSLSFTKYPEMNEYFVYNIDDVYFPDLPEDTAADDWEIINKGEEEATNDPIFDIDTESEQCCRWKLPNMSKYNEGGEKHDI